MVASVSFELSVVSIKSSMLHDIAPESNSPVKIMVRIVWDLSNGSKEETGFLKKELLDLFFIWQNISCNIKVT